MSVTVTSVALADGTELRITGDADNDTINILDSGDGHVEVTDANALPLGEADNVIRIRLNSGDGDDVVNYTLEALLSNRQSLYFDLGAGEDEADLDFAVGIAANLKADVEGGDDNDTLSATMGLITEAHADVDLDGEGGDDNVSFTNVLVVEAEPVFTAASNGPGGNGNGGNGNGGNGTSSATASLDADLDGGWGNDTLAAFLTVDGTLGVDLDVDGGGGDDEMSFNAGAVAGLKTSGENGTDSNGVGTYVDFNGGGGDDTMNVSVPAAAMAHFKLEMQGGSGDDVINVLFPTAMTSVAPGNGASNGSGGNGGVYIDLAGGGGDDTISATLAGVFAQNTRVDMRGDSGDDDLLLVATGIFVSADATFDAKLNGGSGDDLVAGTVAGQFLGTLKYAAEGSSGDDELISNITVIAGSTGEVFAKSAGGAGDDDVTLNVFDESGGGGTSLLAELHAKIFDPGGHDTLVHTDNVEVILNNGQCFGNGLGPGNGLGSMAAAFDRIFDWLGSD